MKAFFFYVHIHTIATIDRHRTTAGTFSSFVFSIKKKKKLFFVSLLTGFFLLNIQNSTYMGLGRAWHGFLYLTYGGFLSV